MGIVWLITANRLLHVQIRTLNQLQTCFVHLRAIWRPYAEQCYYFRIFVSQIFCCRIWRHTEEMRLEPDLNILNIFSQSAKCVRVCVHKQMKTTCRSGKERMGRGWEGENNGLSSGSLSSFIPGFEIETKCVKHYSTCLELGKIPEN